MIYKLKCSDCETYANIEWRGVPTALEAVWTNRALFSAMVDLPAELEGVVRVDFIPAGNVPTSALAFFVDHDAHTVVVEPT